MGLSNVAVKGIAVGLIAMMLGCSDNPPDIAKSDMASAATTASPGTTVGSTTTGTNNDLNTNGTSPITNTQPVQNTTPVYYPPTQYPVVSPAGACGAAANSYPDPFSGPSPASLCAQGTPVGLAGSGPWYWICQGGGGSVSCSTLPCAAEMAAIGVTNITWICSEYQRMYNRLPDIGGAQYWDKGIVQYAPSCRDVAFLAGTVGADCSRYSSLYGQAAPAAACGGVQPTSCP